MRRDDAVLLGALALALLLCLFFLPAPGPTFCTEKAPARSDGIVWREGRALVDLNTADQALLMSLPGIGEKLSQAIIAEREENGPFRDVRDLTRVHGIGAVTARRLMDYSTLRPQEKLSE
ncbi:MAG: ComEA family DNA-binding protein [Candidatus Excrementavichristensenella sp.]|jgi:competence ComEA-like helix-hairpin-helix protein